MHARERSGERQTEAASRRRARCIKAPETLEGESVLVLGNARAVVGDLDLGKAQIPRGSPDELQIGLKLLPPGTYLVSWHVVSVDTHPTEGTFTFEIKP